MLSSTLYGRRLAAPVLYPGSVERTSWVENGEPKGYLALEIAPDAAIGGRLVAAVFHELPTTPVARRTFIAMPGVAAERA
jgi:hypothetical protein